MAQLFNKIGHVYWKPINVTPRRIDSLEVIGISIGRRRPKRTWIETVRYDLKTPNITDNIASNLTEWKHKIHIA